MLKNKYIDLFGTDIHHVKKSYVVDNFKKIEKKIIKITGREYYSEIVNNANKIVSKR